MSRVNVYWFTALGCGLVITMVLLLIPIVNMSSNTEKMEHKKVKVGQAQLIVEVATTPVSQARGLSGRDNLVPNTGMLFVYSAPTTHNFWMQGMKFPLDFIWIADNQVVQIDENIKPPTPANAEPIRVYVQQPYTMVLEAAAGWVKSNNINLGDKIEYK